MSRGQSSKDEVAGSKPGNARQARASGLPDPRERARSVVARPVAPGADRRTRKASRAEGKTKRGPGQERTRLAAQATARAETSPHRFAELSRHHSEAAALLKGAQALLEQREFEPTARAIFDSCKTVVGAEAGYVAMLSEDGGENELLFLDSGDAECTVDPSLPMPVRGLRSEAIRLSRTVYENDFAHCSWRKLLPAGHLNLRNAMFAPIIIEGQSVGLLGLANKDGDFTESDARLASGFAELAGLAFRHDLTQRKLVESERRFRSVAEGAADAIVTSDADGTIVFWNDAAERVFGYRATEILGRPLSQLLPERFRAAHRHGFARAFLPGTPDFIRRQTEVFGLRKDLREVPLELTLSVCSAGPAKFCTAIIRDITERKETEASLRQAHDQLELTVQERTADLQRVVARLEVEVETRRQTEVALTESEARYRRLFDAAPVGIAVSLADGQVLEVNSALCALLRISPAEALSARSTEFYTSKEDRARFMAALREHGAIHGSEAQLRRADDTTFPALLDMREIEWGDERGILTIVQDLTDRKRAQKRVVGVKTLLELFAQKTSQRDYLAAAAAVIKGWCRCDAVGIRRLGDSGEVGFDCCVDFQAGFLNADGTLPIEPDVCPCWYLAKGKEPPPGLPWTTDQGSFVCNDVDRMRKRWSRSPERAPACLATGYQSIASIPFRYLGEVVGFIQLLDGRKGAHDQETLQFLESVSPLIGEAVGKFKVIEALQTSERRFRRMFEHNHATMLLVEPESNSIVDANQAAAVFYGLSREKLCTLSLRDLGLSPPHANSRSGDAVSIEQSCSYSSTEAPSRRGTGSRRSVDVHASLVEVQGQTLSFLIIHDITARKALEKQVLDISERERQRVGRDLHDSVGGNLTGVALMAEALAQTLTHQAAPEARVAREIVDSINNAISEVRTISRGLCPSDLTALGLCDSLVEFSANVRRIYGISCDVECQEGLVIRDTMRAAHLFRIAQEAVHNALRHGKAQRIVIRLLIRGEGLSLRIWNDGLRVPDEVGRMDGLGLGTMRHRANVLGGYLQIRSPGDGDTEVFVELRQVVLERAGDKVYVG